MHLHVFHMHVNFYIRVRDRISDRMHDHTNNRFGWSRFKPLALHTIFFVGPGFESLSLQQDLFVGPGFNSLALIACFWPIVSLAYVSP